MLHHAIKPWIASTFLRNGVVSPLPNCERGCVSLKEAGGLGEEEKREEGIEREGEGTKQSAFPFHYRTLCLRWVWKANFLIAIINKVKSINIRGNHRPLSPHPTPIRWPNGVASVKGCVRSVACMRSRVPVLYYPVSSLQGSHTQPLLPRNSPAGRPQWYIDC